MIIAYYSRPDGSFEKVRLHRLDFDTAARQASHEWSLEAPPAGSEIIDRSREWGDPAYVTSCTAPKVSERDNLRAGMNGPRA
jgi:hypothetical protein